MGGDRPARLLPFLIGIGSLALALAIKVLSGATLGEETPFLLLFVPILLSAWYGSWRIALAIALLTAALAAFLFIPPVYSFAIGSAGVLQIVVFLIETLLIIAVSESRRRAEARAHEEHQRFLVTLGSIGDGVIVTDAEGRVTFVNPVAEKLTGWPRDQALGRLLTETFPIINEQSRQPVENPVQKVLERGVIEGLANHTLLLTRDGRECPIDDTAAPIRDRDRNLTGVILVFRDVTAKRQAEAERETLLVRAEAARAEAERQRDLLGEVMENAPIPMGVLEGPEHRFMQVNQATLELTGMTRAEFLGQPHAQVAPQAHGTLGPLLDAVYRTGKVIQAPEGEIVLPDERTVYLQVTFAPLPGPDGKPAGVLYLALDLTERRWAEKERELLLTRLESERAFLEAVLQQMPGGVAIAEAPSGKILLRNEGSTGILPGARPVATDLADYARFKDLFPGQRHANADQWPLVRALKQGEVISGEEMEFKRGDGTRGTLRVNAGPVLDTSGRIVAAISTYFDVTEEKREEEAAHFLAEAGNVLVSSLDYAATLASVARLVVPRLADWCGVHILEDDGSVRQLAVAHVDPAKVQLAHDLERRYPADPNAPNGVHEVLRTGQARMMATIPEELIVRGARSEEHLHILRSLGLQSYMVVPMTARGRTLGAITFVTAESAYHYGPADLALAEELGRRAGLAVDNARLYREAREQEERFRLVAENVMEHAIILLDHEGRVTAWNAGAERILGYRADEVLGQSAARFMTDEDREAGRFEEELRQAATAGRGVDEGWRVRKDGSRIWASGATSALRTPENGELHGFVKILRDLTERKTLEEELRRHAAELARNNRRKDEFLAMLGHELRNPLSPIRNSAQILRLRGSPDPVVQQAQGMIERQVRQLTRLVDDLLDMSRINQGKIELRKEQVELATLVDRALETTRPLLNERHHQVLVSLPPEPVTLEADPARLEQVLANLLNNAAKYTPAGGRIELTAARVGREVVVQVRDNGIGIRPELLSTIFDLFAQADAVPGKVREGLGIGLTLVRQLVQMHGGTVEAHSAGLGQGSDFIVHLPLTEGPAPTTAAPPQEEQREAGGRVLVVDDSVDGAESLALLLRMQGYEVRVAHDGPAALSEAGRFQPEVVLLDLGLPRGMDGYEVARRLRAQPELRGMLLVAVTGRGQEEDRRRTQETGFDAHLVKPTDPVALRNLLRRLRPRTDAAAGNG